MRVALAIVLSAAACARVGPPAPNTTTPASAPPTRVTASPSPDGGDWITFRGGDPGVLFDAPPWPYAEPSYGDLVLTDPAGAEVEIRAVFADREVTLSEVATRWRAIADASERITKPYSQGDATLGLGRAVRFAYRATSSLGPLDEEVYFVVTGRMFYAMRFACPHERAADCAPTFAKIRDSFRWRGGSFRHH